jgi:PAS domain S-box-containing protein
MTTQLGSVGTSSAADDFGQALERRWRAVFDNSAVGIGLTDASGRFLAANPVLQGMLGYTQAELESMSLIDLTPEPDREATQLRITELLAGRQHEYHAERRYLRRDGVIVWGNASVSVVPGTEGMPQMLVKIVEDITERKRAEAALRENEARLQAILDHSPAKIFLKDLAGRYLLSNREFESITHVPPAAAVGKRDEELFPTEQAAAFRANDLKVLQANVPMEFEEIALHDDGPHTSVVLKFPLKNAEGETYALGGVATDITERKRAEAELLALKDQLAAELAAMTRLHELGTRLLATEELQRLLEEVLDATIALLSADFGNVQLYNRESRALEIVAQRGFEQDFLDYFDRVHDGTASCGEAMQRRERVIVEDVLSDPLFAPHLAIVAAAGYRAVQSTPLLGRGGEFLGMISTHFREPHRPSERELRLTDLYARQAAELIERRRAEEKLRRSEAYLAEGQRLTHTASWVWNASSGDLFWSVEHFRIFGLDPETVKPSHEMVFRMLHPEDQAFVEREFQQAIRDKAEFDKEFRIVRPDGTVRHIHSVAWPRLNGSGALAEYVGTIIDVSEQRRAEAALRRAQEQVARVTRAMSMGELTASIAHEVNQPLAAIVANGNACLRWLARDPPELEEARGGAERIVRDANRASEVIAGIRAFLMRGEPHRARTDLEELIDEVIALVLGDARAHDVSLQRAVAADLPSVVADRAQLQQVLLNLAKNAIEAMSSLTGRARVLEFGADRHGGASVVVAVRDSGVGLDPQDETRIFDHFYTTKPDGLGMGLAISRSIVEAHGGRLWAAANDGPGETFRFTLPL